MSADNIIVVCASKVTQLGVLRSTHSSKTKSRQANITTIKELFFCIFDKNDANKNKVKKVSKTITK
jgi:hypothetical protein